MSHQQLILDLKKSRESAAAALNEIFFKLTKCKDNTKNKSSISYNGVHAICMAIKDKGDFYEIYADAIEKLATDVSDIHWNMFVELLRFILSEFYSKNLFKRTFSLANLVTADRIVTAADVKSHLKLFSRQLYYSHTLLNEDEVNEIFKHISQILLKCKEIQFEDLIEDFHTHILGAPSMLQTVIIKHLNKVISVFDILFTAIGSVKVEKNKLDQSFLLLTKYLINFIYLDVTDKNTVFSQNFLRSCKENQSFKAHKYQNYALNLFYWFVKLLLFPNTLDFNRNFTEIIEKLSIFFDRSEFLGESWFMDTIVTTTRILDSFKGQKIFLKAMHEDSHKKFYALIEKMIKLAPGVNYESGLWACCNSVRKHIIFKLCIVQMTMFEAAVEQGFTKSELGISVGMVLKHTIAVAECFKCSTANYEVALIINSLTRCAQNVKTKEHAELLSKMLLLPIKAKDHLPENSVRTILKCLMQVQKVSENVQGQAEAYALYIAHLMESKIMDTELIKKYIGVFYSLEACMSVCETLEESKFPLKPSNFSRFLLHSMETRIYHKTRINNSLVITSLLKTAPSILDFVLVARLFPQVNVIKKLERKYAELRSGAQQSPLGDLSLGHICKLCAVQQMDDLKNVFSVSKISDESLGQISDPGKLKLIDVVTEMKIMKIALEGIEAFERFFEFSSQKTLPNEDFSVDWEPIIDDVAMLARLFHFRGYVDSAYTAWRLLLRISSHVDDILNRIRALGFLCDEILFIELFDPDFDIEQEIRSVEKSIYECVLNLDFLTPRRQNYVLICLCNIGWYLATKRRFYESQLLLNMALEKVEELADRKNKFEIVRATHLAVSFRIKWKLQKGISKRMAFAQVDRILDEIRAVVYYTSEDSLNFPTLMFAVVNDISEFTTNRLCEPATIPYVQMVLKLALDTGAAFRLVQFLILWTHINLQTENASKCQAKLDLIDKIFRNSQPAKSTSENLKKNLDIIPTESYINYGEEAVRKAVYVNPISPVRLKHKAPTIQLDLKSLLINHGSSCTCDKCSHTFLNWQFFKIGCLNARLLYLSDVYNEAETFYSKALEWCRNKSHKTHTKFYFIEYEFSMFIHYINLLRRMKSFNEAISISKSSLEVYNNFKDTLDGVYKINLSVQLESTTAEMNRKSIKPKSPKVRRLLKFSPPIDAQPKIELQPLTVTKRRTRAKKESPQTIKENIDNIIYKDSVISVSRAKSTQRREKPTNASAIDDICKTVEKIQLSEEFKPKKPTITVTSSRKRGAKQDLNNAIIIIDDNDSPVPTQKLNIPKSASKIECTPKTRGRSRKPPATIAVPKTDDVESKRKLLRRRI